MTEILGAPGNAFVFDYSFESGEWQALDDLGFVDQLVDVEIAVCPGIPEREAVVEVDGQVVAVHGGFPGLT